MVVGVELRRELGVVVHEHRASIVVGRRVRAAVGVVSDVRVGVVFQW